MGFENEEDLAAKAGVAAGGERGSTAVRAKSGDGVRKPHLEPYGKPSLEAAIDVGVKDGS